MSKEFESTRERFYQDISDLREDIVILEEFCDTAVRILAEATNMDDLISIENKLPRLKTLDYR